MQISKRTFRFLVVLPLFLSFVSYGLGMMPFSRLPEKAEEAKLERTSLVDNMNMYFGMAIMLGSVLLYLLAMLGMLIFWNVARILYLASVLIQMAWSFTVNPHVNTGIHNGMAMIMTFVIGLVVAISYTSNIAELFEQPRTISA